MRTVGPLASLLMLVPCAALSASEVPVRVNTDHMYPTATAESVAFESEMFEILPLDDARILNRRPLGLAATGSTASSPGFYDVDEYMLGSVAINVILPESDGSIDPDTEDWTQVEQDSVAAQILAGLSWWVGMAKWRDLSFQVLFSYSVPTGYEPITRTADEESLWVCDVLEHMGYADATYPHSMYARANDLRDSLGTDWALLVFVVDSSNDADGLFAGGAAAYAYFGGPNMIMSYKNGGAGIQHMDYILMHELSHSFYAVDEYSQVPCTFSSGYLNVENQNGTWPNGPGSCAINLYTCILRMSGWANRALCTYSKGQIGWWDSDGDSICNVLDTDPETSFSTYPPDPCSTPTPTYTGLAWVIPLENLNPFGPGNDVTLERITKVEWRVDGGEWHLAVPSDGSWDGTEEAFNFTTDSLGTGTHVVQARAFQTCGNSDTSFACDTLSLDTSGIGPGAAGSGAAVSIGARPNPFGANIGLTYFVPGAAGQNVSVSVVVYDVTGREIRRLVEGLDRTGLRGIAWDGRDAGGRLVPGGIYFVRLTADAAAATAKVVLTR